MGDVGFFWGRNLLSGERRFLPKTPSSKKAAFGAFDYLLVSCRASGLLNRPLAALAFGTLKPLFEENRFFAQKKRCRANLFLFLRAFFALSFFTKV